MPPAMLGVVNQISQVRAPRSSVRYAHMLPNEPGPQRDRAGGVGGERGHAEPDDRRKRDQRAAARNRVDGAADQRGEKDEQEAADRHLIRVYRTATRVSDRSAAPRTF